MMISTTTQTRKKNKIKLWTIAFWLLLWQFASMALDKQILLASPLSVGRCLLSLVRTFSFWES
ncbi:MAG: nitrate ABC transporter permease, partial [Roseburia sp.]|nr:nitrate ABC transporter permease [Roseburia sp.]